MNLPTILQGLDPTGSVLETLQKLEASTLEQLKQNLSTDRGKDFYSLPTDIVLEFAAETFSSDVASDDEDITIHESVVFELVVMRAAKTDPEKVYFFGGVKRITRNGEYVPVSMGSKHLRFIFEYSFEEKQVSRFHIFYT